MASLLQEGFQRQGGWLLLWVGFIVALTGCNMTIAVDTPPVAPTAPTVATVVPATPRLPTPEPSTTPVASPTERRLSIVPTVPLVPTSEPTETVVVLQAEPTPETTVLAPPDRIVVPSIGLDVTVAPVGWTVTEENGTLQSAWNVPLDVAGWHQNSAVPGGQGNVVLSGHHNLGREVFRRIVELRVGDEIILGTGGVPHRYVVTDRFILPERGISEAQRAQNALWIAPTRTERLTLVTCWPYTDNSHRVIVVAAPTENGLDYGG